MAYTSGHRLYPLRCGLHHYATQRDEVRQDTIGDKCKHIAETVGVNITSMNQFAYRNAAVDAACQLSVGVGIPTKLKAMKDENLEFLVQSAADACIPGKPKATSVENFKELFRKIM